MASGTPPAARAVRFGRSGATLLVVDNFLPDPAELVRHAWEEARFGRNARFGYPGAVAEVPQSYREALRQGLGPILGEVFGVETATARVTSSFFAIATEVPRLFADGERIPHTDGYDPHRLAVLHYLCEPWQGGTAFYRHRATGYEWADAARDREILPSRQAKAVAPAGEFVDYDWNPANSLFEEIARVEAFFNRLIVYRSVNYHSGLIGPYTRLEPDPRVGRLTVNTFINFDPPG